MPYRCKTLTDLEEDFKRRKIADIGMLKALRAAGWGVKDLADEFRCAEEVVIKTMKREGIK